MSPVFSYLTKAFILMRILFPLRRILAPFEHHQYKSKEARSILVFRELKDMTKLLLYFAVKFSNIIYLRTICRNGNYFSDQGI